MIPPGKILCEIRCNYYKIHFISMQYIQYCYLITYKKPGYWGVHNNKTRSLFTPVAFAITGSDKSEAYAGQA